MKAILTVGPSCCGKSYWTSNFIKEQQKDTWYHLERDKIRFDTFTSGIRDWTRYKFCNKNEEIVSKIYDEYLNLAISLDKNLVLSDTWLSSKYRNQMLKKLNKAGYDVTIKDDWENLTWDNLVKRNIQREGGISLNILWDQYQRFLDYKGVKRYVGNDSLPQAIICDIDGTIADHTNIRSPFEENKVFRDRVIWPVADIIHGLSNKYEILFFSGRSEDCREDTLKWLTDICRFTDFEFELHMRKSGDTRRDSIVKEELFWEYAAPRFNVVAAIDDRNQVLRETWYKLQIKCIHVGHMYVEF